MLAYLCISLPMAFLWLGRSDIHVMEGIVADGARYMESTGELAVPHLHGEIYNFKPPGAYWMALASTWLFGEESEWTLRFPFALSGVLMGLAVLWLAGDVLGPWRGFHCAVATVATRLVIPRLHLAEWDVALAAGVGLAVVVACRIFAGERANSALWLLGYLGLAFGFLVKGAPALILYVPGLLGAAMLTRRVRDLFRPAHLAGVALFVTISGSWIVAAAAAEGWTVFSQPLSEAGAKGLGWTWAALARAFMKPPVFVALALPWSATLPVLVRPKWWREMAPAEKRLAQSAAAFAVLGVAILTVVSAREMRYFLPLAVPMAVLCGMAAGHTLEGSRWSKMTAGIANGLAVLLGAAAIAAGAMGVASVEAGRAADLLVVAAGLATLGLVAARVRRSTLRPVFGVLLAASVCFWLINAQEIEPRRVEKRSLRTVAETFEPYVQPGETIWTTPVSPGFHHSSLFFYLGRPVRTVTETDYPETGSHVVLFSDEPADKAQYRLPFDYSIVASGSSRNYEFLLVKVG